MSKFITPVGEIEINIIGHASILLRWNGNVIITDPYSEIADYSLLPKADLVLITHDHYDHLDKKALKYIVTSDTVIVTNISAQRELKNPQALKPGDEFDFKGVNIKAVFAYNIVNMTDSGHPFHPKGVGVGYVLSFGGFKVYFAGDTELIEEMKGIGNIDLAFLPKNLPYTMSDEMFIEVAKLIMPKNLYAYHYFHLDEKSIRAKLPVGINFFTE